MANNNSENRNFRRQMKLFEEEEIDRRLKEAGLYDSTDTFETRKLIVMRVLGGLTKPPKVIEKKQPSSNPNLNSFENEFNIVDDEDNVEESGMIDESSTKQRGKKADWKTLFQTDNSDEEELGHLSKNKTANSVKTSIQLVQQNNVIFEKDESKNASERKVKMPESYGRKMFAASVKKNPQNANEEASTSSSKVNPLKVHEKRSEEDDLINDTTAHTLDLEVTSDVRKDESVTLTDRTSDMDDDEFLPIIKDRLSQSKSVQSSTNVTQVTKTQAMAMRSKCNKYSEILKLVDQIEPSHLPATYDFQSKGSYEKLIENEEKLERICQESCYKPVTWRKPIILDVSNNRKRRPIFHPPSKKTSPSREVTKPADDFEIICDSPPTLPLWKLDLSQQSPVLESGASRNRSAVARTTEVIDTEMEPPCEQRIIKHTEKEISKDCPICNKSFPLDEIEDHAAGCFSFEAEEAQERPRIATRSARSRHNWNEHVPRGDGAEPAAGTSTDIVIETDPSDKEDSDSDFEFNDIGTKRNRKRDLSKGKKRRI